MKAIEFLNKKGYKVHAGDPMRISFATNEQEKSDPKLQAKLTDLMEDYARALFEDLLNSANNIKG